MGAMEDFRAGGGQEQAGRGKTAQRHVLDGPQWNGERQGVENEHLVLRTIHRTGFVVAT